MMSSLFKLNQLNIPQELPVAAEINQTVLDQKDKEIYALRQQLQTLKTLYKSVRQQDAQAKQAALEEVAALHGQLEFLKTRLAASQAALKTEHEHMYLLKEENVKLLESLKNAQELIERAKK